MTYAIIRLGGKQYRVREGERLRVDRLHADEGQTFEPDLLFVPDGDAAGVAVTARVVGHLEGDKIRIGKYRRRTGYKRHNGFRASLTEIQIEAIGRSGRAAPATRTASEPVAPPEPAAPSAKPVAPSEPPSAEPASAGVPEGYADLKVSEVAAAAKEWDRAGLEAALAHERANANRKGAVSALESALKKLDRGDA